MTETPETTTTKLDHRVRRLMILLPSNLKLLRRMQGLTQGQLAKLIGKSNKAVKDYESGFSEPKLSVLAKLSEILEVSIHDILSRDFNDHPIILLGEADSNAGVILQAAKVESFLNATNKGQKIQDGLLAYENFSSDLDLKEFDEDLTSQQLLVILQEILTANWNLIDEMTNVGKLKKLS